MWHPSDRLFTHLAAEQPQVEEPFTDVADTPHSCSYCGAQEFDPVEDTGRGLRAICSACGGAMLRTEDGQWAPAGLNSTHNHPREDGDPGSGGVGGAANVGTDPDRMNDASARHGSLGPFSVWDISTEHTAAGEDFRLQHQAPTGEVGEDGSVDGSPMHDLSQNGKGVFPEDVYTHPHYYDSGHEDYMRAWSTAKGARGNPEKRIKIYRSLPAEHAHTGFNHGDWVSTSKQYARDHGKSDDPKHDWPVISTTVPAKHLHNEGDLMEWGYSGPHKEPLVAFKGGHHQEVRQRADGSVRPVQRREGALHEGADNPVPIDTHALRDQMQRDRESYTGKYGAEEHDPAHQYPEIGQHLRSRGIKADFGGMHSESARIHDQLLSHLNDRYPGILDTVDSDPHVPMSSEYAHASGGHITYAERAAQRRGQLGMLSSGPRGHTVAGGHAGIAAHEFGHALTHYVGIGDLNLGGLARQLHPRAATEGRAKELATKKISEYAQHGGPDELTAEAFADNAVRGKNAAPYSQAIAKRMDDVYHLKNATEGYRFEHSRDWSRHEIHAYDQNGAHIGTLVHDPKDGDRLDVHPDHQGSRLGDRLHHEMGKATRWSYVPGMEAAGMHREGALNDEVPWCAHLYHGNCTYPGDKLPNGTILGIPQDRGLCPWKHSASMQAACPISEPGPMAVQFREAVAHHDLGEYHFEHLHLPTGEQMIRAHHPDVPSTPTAPAGQAGWMAWDHEGTIRGIHVHPDHRRGGLATEMYHRAQEIDPSVHHSDDLTEDGAQWSQKVGLHVEGSWADVRNKAKRIRREGGVHITVASPDGVAGTVQGDQGVYESLISFAPGTRRVASWRCDCPWFTYAFDRSAKYEQLQGRMCSHCLALNYEAQSRGMFGNQVKVGTVNTDEIQDIVTQAFIEAKTRLDRDDDPAEVIGYLITAGLPRDDAQNIVLAARGRTALRKVARKCPECGAELDSNDNRCGDCGAVLPDHPVTHKASTHHIDYSFEPYPGESDPLHTWTMRDEHGNAISELHAFPESGEIANVWTHPSRRREGLSTEIYDHASKMMPLYHAPSEHRTPEGDGWARAVGGDTVIPERAYHPTFEANKRGPLQKPHQCKYCKQPATKAVRHSEGMAYIPACDQHLDDAQDAAANCLPYGGGPDYRNIDGVVDLPKTAVVLPTPWSDSHLHEVSGPYYHGGAAGIDVGDHVDPAHSSTGQAYFTTRKEEAAAYADRAHGSLYEVEPTGDFGHSSASWTSFASPHPLRVTREVPQEEWWTKTASWGDDEQHCPHCGGYLGPEAFKAGRCPHCGHALAHKTGAAIPPGWEGAQGPFEDEYSEPHVYARDIHSGAGNCVCGGGLGDSVHIQAAPGVDVPEHQRTALSDPDYRPHRTQDARSDAPVFGKGVDDWGLTLVDCPQCGGKSGCGHCGGSGQVISTGGTTGNPTPDQNPAAGDAIREDGISDTSALHPQFAAKENAGPSVAGVALKAADTGRILMLQRGLEDKKDPARGLWEIPGGHVESGDRHTLDTAVREWCEEVGQPFPEGGVVTHAWTSPNGVYQGHVVVIPRERDLVMHDGRVVPNPDDPKGDHAEQAAWWHPDHARKNPALRPEMKNGTPWDKIKEAGSDTGLKVEALLREGAAWDSLYSLEESQPVTPPAHSESENPISTGFLTTQDPASWSEVTKKPHHLLPADSLDSPLATLHSVPEGALPFTDGADDLEDSTSGTADPYHGQTDTESLDGDTDTIPDTEMEGSPMEPLGGMASKRSVADIVEQFQRTAGAAALQSGSGGGSDVGFSNEEIAAKAKERLAGMSKTALKNFTFAEQQELIGEGKGTRARNFDALDVTGTHYQALNEALSAADLNDDDILIL
jgi:8-oxo-dGTP pyrophosphatase MutT (NUDIX family)